jgi:hypothetical protein
MAVPRADQGIHAAFIDPAAMTICVDVKQKTR